MHFFNIGSVTLPKRAVDHAAVSVAGQSLHEPRSHYDFLEFGCRALNQLLLRCCTKSSSLLRSPYLNKGSAFTPEERHEFKLHGLLPPNVQTLEEQVERAYAQYSNCGDALAKNTFMTSMKEQNEVLYYGLIQDHLKEMFPIIYTPTEGEAIQNYSRLFRRPEGCFLNIFDQDRIEDNIAQWGEPDDVDLVVVSDGEQILGIGDQGVGGILISVAKLVIYTLCSGIHPTRTLPVVLDCGTDNHELLNDELYLGLRQPRVRGEEYDNFVSTFVQSVRKSYPKAYIHFEDFGLHNARRILDKYQPEIACFNDDVQGTGCVTLAAIMAASHVSKVKLQDMRFVLFGSGTAGTGIADQIKDAIAHESGKSKDEAGQQIWCVDKPGLLLKSKKDQLTPAQMPYARDDQEWEGKDHNDLLSVVREVKPHVLIGTSTKPKTFTKEVVQEMAKHVDRPIIFPLSNPTRLHEADPRDINKWTEGRALIATGSPFPPVEHDGVQYEVAECNNSVTFPGIGLGAVLSRTRLLPPSMLVAATKALAAQAPALKDPNAGLLPDVTDVREISVQIAKAVIQQAVKEGLNQEKDIPEDDADLEEWIREQMWDAQYRPLKKVERDSASAHAKGEAGSATSHRSAKV
ncbi:NAD-dependent malic enzyme, mitochondrial [Cryomyces antarcticus]|nr:NAD-dependent malic enzyme, mitochondrial [Cryomyces antarcticus]KAK5020791.1 NAD-dependent malic enzyme, mitochondrial [Cryomyces antarcticus]